MGKAGNRLTATEQLLASSLNANPKTIGRIYAYDDVYRLTGETITGTANAGSASYSYDPVGNRQSRDVVGLPLGHQSFGFDANDRLNTDSYDANGNTLVGLGFGQSQADQYDFENRLVTRHTPSATITVQYDGDGNRVSKTVATATNTVKTFYVVDDLNPTGYAQVLEEYTSQNAATPVLQTVYNFGLTLISQDRWNGGHWSASFYGYDGHNNVRYLTDANGNVTDTYDYDAFGNLLAVTGQTENCYLFTGEQYDPDLGLYYLRARYHNTDTGRFWNMDSYEGEGSDPSSLHKYTYCGNNPANAYDRSGNDTSLLETMGGQAIASICSGALGNMFLGAWGRLWTAAGDGSDIIESVFNSDAINNDFDSGALWGLAGFGVGKVGLWLVGKVAPLTPTFCLAYNRATAGLNKALNSLETAWAQVESEIKQGSQAAIQAARNAAVKAQTQVASLMEEASGESNVLGWGGVSSEAYASTQLGRLQAQNSGAHFLSRHGAQTTIEEQFKRATTGLAPDGFQATRFPDASRFLSNQDMLDAAMEAMKQFNNTGSTRINFVMGKVIGEGYTSGGANYIVTQNVRAIFRNGKLFTLFPYLNTLP